MTSASPYDTWIEAYLLEAASVVGQCQPACTAMLEAFPELRLRAGYVKTPLGLDTHYWLLAPDDTIVDPTVSQFGALDPSDYEDAGTTEPFKLLERFFVYR